jgi:hypothetical protein
MLVMLKFDSQKKLDTHALLGRGLSFIALFLYSFDLFYSNCMVVLMILIILYHGNASKLVVVFGDVIKAIPGASHQYSLTFVCNQ